MAKFFPSEIARLVLGYLRDLPCPETQQKFLVECPHLREYYQLLQEGEAYPTDVNGKSLTEILKEYCTLKRESSKSSANVPSSSNTANHHVPLPTPVANPDSSNPEGFKTPCKSNHVALVKHRSTQKSQTQSVTTTLSYQTEVRTPRLNLSSKYSSPYTPRRLTGAITTPLSFTGDSPPHKSSTAPIFKRTANSDPIPRKSHRFVQTDACNNDHASHSLIPNSATTPPFSHSIVQNSQTAENETVKNSHCSHITDSLPDSITNQQLSESTPEIISSENSVTLTLESSVTPQYITDPPPYARAPATNSPRLILSLDRSQIASLTTPLKHPRNWVEESASPKRKGLIPRRRLLSESPNPKNVSDDLIINSFINEDVWTDLLKSLQSVPTAQMIADNINRAADINSINRPDEIAKNLNTDYILDELFSKEPSLYPQVLENLGNQIDKPSTSSYNVECSQSVTSANSFTEDCVVSSQASNDVNNYQSYTINTSTASSFSTKTAEENPATLAHCNNKIFKNQPVSRNLISDSTINPLDQTAIEDNAMNSQNNNRSFSSVEINSNVNINNSNSGAIIQQTSSVITSAEQVTSVTTSAQHVTSVVASAQHVMPAVTSDAELTFATSTAQATLATPATQANSVVTSAQASSVVTFTEQVTPVATSADNESINVSMDSDEIQIIKEIPPTPEKIKPVQYITTNTVPEQNSTNNNNSSGVNFVNNSVFQSINSIPQTLYLLPNGQYIIPNTIPIGTNPFQSNVSYKIILPAPSNPAQNSSTKHINNTSINTNTSVSSQKIMSSSNNQSCLQDQNLKKSNNVKQIKPSPKSTKTSTKLRKGIMPPPSTSFTKLLDIEEECDDPSIPVISIPENEIELDHSKDAMEIFSNITGKKETQSPIFKALVSTAFTLLGGQGGGHVRTLNFGQSASNEANMKSPKVSSHSMPEINVENRRSSPRLKNSNVKSQFKRLSTNSQEILELNKNKTNITSKEGTKNNKSSSVSSNKQINRSKSSKQTLQNATSMKDAVLIAMDKAMAVNVGENRTKAKSSSKNKNKKKFKSSSATGKRNKYPDILKSSTKKGKKTKSKIVKAASKKTSNAQEHISNVKFFPSSDSESESDFIPLSSLTASKSPANINTLCSLKPGNKINNSDGVMQNMKELSPLKGNKNLEVSKNILSDITENTDLSQDQYSELPALPFEVCIDLSKSSDNSMDVLSPEGNKLVEIISPLKFSDVKDTLSSKSADSKDDTLLDHSKAGNNLSTLVANELQLESNQNKTFSSSESNNNTSAVSSPSPFKEQNTRKSPKSKVNATLNSKFEDDNSCKTKCLSKELITVKEKNNLKLPNLSVTLNKEQSVENIENPPEHLSNLNQCVLFACENENIKEGEHGLVQSFEAVVENSQIPTRSENYNEKQSSNMEKSKKNYSKKIAKKPHRSLANSDQLILASSEHESLDENEETFQTPSNVVENIQTPVLAEKSKEKQSPNLKRSRKNSTKKVIKESLESLVNSDQSVLVQPDNEILDKNEEIMLKTSGNTEIPALTENLSERQPSSSKISRKNSVKKTKKTFENLVSLDQDALAMSENKLLDKSEKIFQTSENTVENTQISTSAETLTEKHPCNLKRSRKNSAKKTKLFDAGNEQLNEDDEVMFHTSESVTDNTSNYLNERINNSSVEALKENSYSLTPSSNVLHKTDNNTNSKKQLVSSSGNKTTDDQTKSDSLPTDNSLNESPLKPIISKVSDLEHKKIIEAKANRLEGIADKLKSNASSPCKIGDSTNINAVVDGSGSISQSSVSATKKPNQDNAELSNSRQDKFLRPPKKRIRPVPIPSPRDSSSISSFSPFHVGENAFCLETTCDSNSIPVISAPNSNNHERSKSSNFETQHKEVSQINNLPVNKEIPRTFKVGNRETGKPKAMAEFYKNALPERNSDLPISPDTVSSSSCTLETYLVRRNLSNKFIVLENVIDDSTSFSLFPTSKEFEETNKSNEPLDMSVNCDSSTSSKINSPLKNVSREKRKISQLSPVSSNSIVTSDVMDKTNCISSEIELVGSGNSPLKKKMKLSDDEIKETGDSAMLPSALRNSHSPVHRDLDNHSHPSDVNVTFEKTLQDHESLMSFQNSNAAKSSLPSDDKNINNYKGKELGLLSTVTVTKLISSNESPVRSFSPSRNAVKKSALSQRTEQNPKIPSGVKIPSKWDTSKISNYSKSIENYKEISKVSKEKNVENKKAWTLRIASSKSPKKVQSDLRRRKLSHDKRNKKTDNSKDSKREIKRESPRKSKKHHSQDIRSSSHIRKTPTPHKSINSYKHRDRNRYRASEKRDHSDRKRSGSHSKSDNRKSPVKNLHKDAILYSKSASSSRSKDKLDRYKYEVIPLSKTLSDANKVLSHSSISFGASISHQRLPKAISPVKALKSSVPISPVSVETKKTILNNEVSSLEEGEISEDLISDSFVQNNSGPMKIVNSSPAKMVTKQVKNPHVITKPISVVNSEEVIDERTPEDELELQQAIASLTSGENKFNSSEDVKIGENEIPNDSFSERNISSSKSPCLEEPVMKSNLQVNKKHSPTVSESKITKGDERTAFSHPKNASFVNMNHDIRASKQKSEAGLDNTTFNEKQNNCLSVNSSSETGTIELSSSKSNSSSAKTTSDAPTEVLNISSTSLGGPSNSKKKKVSKRPKEKKPVDAADLMEKIKSFGVEKLLELLNKEALKE